MTEPVHPQAAASPGAAASPEAAASSEAAAPTAPTALDRAYAGAATGDARAFEAWLNLAEGPLRRSLGPFAPAVDVEAVLQEALLRMWKLAPALRLTGPDASLRYAQRTARNLAISEARRLKRLPAVELDALEHLPEGSVDPDPVPDPGLRRLIMECIERLPRRPREALRARLRAAGCSPDRDLAATLRMKLNTFHQNIGRARSLVADCLRHHGVQLGEVGS